jgi:SPX domain
MASLESSSSPATGSASAAAADHQDHGDSTGEESRAMGAPEFLSEEAAAAADPSSAEQCKEELGKSPGEIAFFKLLHTEFRKASYFFDKAQTEFEIREERVREGMNIMKQPNSILVNEKWSMLAKSIFRLYKDLLLLETYAIMAYCSFSKILKKHDKVTGHNTRSAFMVRNGAREMPCF